MKTIIQVSTLQEALSNVTRALAARSANPILEGVMIESGKEENTLSLTCSDGSLSIQSVIPAEIMEGGQVVLPGRFFFEAARKMTGGELKLTANREGKAKLENWRMVSNITGMDPYEYPEMAEVSAASTMIALPQVKFKDMINKVAFSIATDENRKILTGCLLEVTADEARLVALDGFRLALQKYEQSFSLPAGKEKIRVVIPGRVMNELSRLLSDTEDPCVMEFDSSRITITFNNTRINSVLLAGEFIDYARILPAEFKTEVLIRREELLQAIDQASLYAREGKNNLIRIKIQDKQSVLSANSEIANVSVELDLSLTGDPLDIAFNAKYLSDAVRSITEEEIVMHFNSPISPCVISAKEGNQYLYLILPVRVSQ